MNSPLIRSALVAIAGLAAISTAGSQNSAEAGLKLPKIKGPKIKLPKIKLPKIKPPKIKPPKIDLKKLKPQVRFRVSAKLKRGTVRLMLVAEVRIGKKRMLIPVLDMAVKKTKKTLHVKRKVGKLSVALKISWAGSRSLTISGTARYLKIKVPMPRLRVRV